MQYVLQKAQKEWGFFWQNVGAGCDSGGIDLWFNPAKSMKNVANEQMELKATCQLKYPSKEKLLS